MTVASFDSTFTFDSGSLTFDGVDSTPPPPVPVPVVPPFSTSGGDFADSITPSQWHQRQWNQQKTKQEKQFWED